MPTLIHVLDLTQPQGHSTSGSHERYKTKERLEWEKEYDCNLKFREWILANELSTPQELERIEKEGVKEARDGKEAAWAAYFESIKHDQIEAAQIITTVAQRSRYKKEILEIKKDLTKINNPLKMDFFKAIKKTLILTRKEKLPSRQRLINWLSRINEDNQDYYSSHLFSQSEEASLKIKEVKPVFSENSSLVDGREVLQAFLTGHWPVIRGSWLSERI
jgi:2-oxoisovalerate dehydrogenase E1 component